MKANELRIGNWAQSTQKEQFKCNADDILICVKIPEIYLPILLDESWHIKFDISCEMGDMIFSIFTHKGDFHVYKDLVKYVHQYQNLYFALTGEELTIKS